MFETILLLVFCLIAGLIALAVCVYLAMSGLLFSVGGLFFALISLTIGGIFILNVVWSIYTGELKQMLEHIRKKPAPSEMPGNPPTEASR
ncbi:MAG: hypothetical protein ACYDA9_04340 [Terriglobia bacterium]